MTAAEADELLERWQQAMEALRPVLEAWRKAVLELWQVLSESLRPLLAALPEWWGRSRREELYRRLRRWRVPHCIARFMARRWPERWLPWLESVG